MKVPQFSNHYALLALFLSPWKDMGIIKALADAIKQGEPDWKKLLYLANLHLCTPLWFVCLKKDGLISLLPQGLQTYLQHLHQANMERNEAFCEAIREIHTKLREHEIPAILLKGAAALCDDLYGDLGARMMGDIDILVKPQHARLVQKLLSQLGYDELHNSFADHHLPRQIKRGTPVAVEVHFQVANGQAGRIIPANLSWEQREIKTWEFLTLSVLKPTYRLIHNTVHALVPHRTFIESRIYLHHLAEFNNLSRRYGREIDWREWLKGASDQGLRKQFCVYLALAQRLMGMPIIDDVPKISPARIHVARISAAGNAMANFQSVNEKRPKTNVLKAKRIAENILIKIHQRLSRPAWLWHNKFHKKGLKNFPDRFFCVSKLVVRQLILDCKSILKNPSRLFSETTRP